MSVLSLENIDVRLGNRKVLGGVSLMVGPGEFVGLLGPNGAGKTTLLRAALGLLPLRGRCSLAALAPKARARIAAFLPQAREIAWPMDVERVVSLGRLPHLRPGVRATGEDLAAIEAALEAMDLMALRHRTATRLSGGEQARVLLARVLAQDTPLILADEPIAGLDPAHQIATMQTFASLARDGRTVIASLHDLTLAHRWCTRIVLLDRGLIIADGAPEEAMTAPNLRGVFGVDVRRVESTDGPVLHVVGRAS